MELKEKNLIDSFWLNKRVLITGHTGFKGTWFSIWLSMKGAEIYGFSLKITHDNFFYTKTMEEKKIVKNYEGDIRNLQDIRNCIDEVKPHIVFHLAAQSLVQTSYKKPIDTWDTNVIGTLNILESLKSLSNKCAIIIVTSDKVYENKETLQGYKESDKLGGKDPYSSSKAATEILVSSWRFSFVGNSDHQTERLLIATVRSGNVIGGGDWSDNRIVPDFVKAASTKQILEIRNPQSVRPWQHVLDTLNGYILLAEELYKNEKDLKKKKELTSGFNFGPNPENNKTVLELVNKCCEFWPCSIKVSEDMKKTYESKLLTLDSNKSMDLLGWQPILNFYEAIKNTINWYREFNQNISAYECCKKDILKFEDKKNFSKKN